MSNTGKLQLDDFSPELQQNFNNDRLTLSNGQTGFNGFGFNPLGIFKRIDDNDPSIVYSTNDWTRQYLAAGVINEGLNSYRTFTSKVGATLTVSFVGTGLILSSAKFVDNGRISVSIDDGAETIYDLYVANGGPHYYTTMASNLVYGAHTIKITVIDKNSAASNPGYVWINHFEVITQMQGKNLLPPYNQGWVASNTSGTEAIISPYMTQFIKTSSTDWRINNSPYLLAVAGQTYSASVDVTVSSTIVGTGAYLEFYFYDASNTQIGTTQASVYTKINATLKIENRIAPAGTKYIRAAVLIYIDTTGTITFSNPMLNIGSTVLQFETNGYDKVTLVTDKLWSKSSAFVGGNRIDALTNVTQSIPEITNLVTNANFERIAPAWENVFADDFNRADGAVGNGWVAQGSASAISANQVSVPISSIIVNGDTNWVDREIRFSFVAPNSTSLFVHIKEKDANNRIAGAIIQGSANNLYFFKTVNGVSTNQINLTSITITSGTTYYVSSKSQGNIYTISVYSDVSYSTLVGTASMYSEELTSGKIGFQAGGAAVAFDNVVVTAPTPDGWQNVNGISGWRGTSFSYANGVARVVVPNVAIDNTSYEMYLSTNANLQLAPNTTYTVSYEVKGDANHEVYAISETGTLVQAVQSISITSNWQTVTMTFTTTADITGMRQLIRFDNNGKLTSGSVGELYIKNVILVQGSVVPAFHTKESRCDLISLRNDGQVVVTQGNGASELGYRVEGEDGSISKWYRSKNTVQHWDRTKVWKSGTGWNNDKLNSNSNGLLLWSAIVNDAFYISFVGTGIDWINNPNDFAGVMGITINNQTEFYIDIYNPVNVRQNRTPIARNLPYGQHIIKFRVTNTKNTLSSSTGVNVDAFDIYVPAIPTNLSSTTLLPVSAVIKADPDYGWIRYEDSEGVLYNGTWYNLVGGENSNNDRHYNNTTNDYAEFSFIGNGIRYICEKSTNSGIAEILLDSGSGYVSQGSFDAYSSYSQGNNVLFTKNTNFGLNKIKINITGTKNASSTSTYAIVDAFDVKNTMYVIDLRKNQSQMLIEQKIAEHEAKDLWDAHPQAIKGMNPKERTERGSVAVSVTSANAGISAAITFAKSFTLPPTLNIWIIMNNSGTAGYTHVQAQNGSNSTSTTGAAISITSYLAQTVTIGWEAIGY